MKNDLASIETLRVLGALAHDCTRCVLSESRTNVVFGAGAPDADVMIVGEGPGQQEDEQGVPFVGRSGQLLDRLLGEIDLDRDDDPPPGYEPAELELVKRLADEKKAAEKARDKSRLKKLAKMGFEGESQGEIVLG